VLKKEKRHLYAKRKLFALLGKRHRRIGQAGRKKGHGVEALRKCP